MQEDGAFSSPAQLMRYLKAGAMQAAQYWEHLREQYEVGPLSSSLLPCCSLEQWPHLHLQQPDHVVEASWD